MDSNKLVLYCVGAGLVLAGLAIWLSGSLAMPTRHPPVAFHYSGVSLFLLGASPIAVGGMCIGIARGVLDREALITRVIMGVGIALFAAAVLIVPKF